MKIQHLRFLAAVVEYGGVIKAAERLHLSQPSVSAGLKALEQTLGRPLFDRSIPANRPLRLTPAGRRFYRHAREILRQCDVARADFLGEAEELRRIRVGVLNTLPHEAIAALVQAVAKQAPNVRLEVWEASPSVWPDGSPRRGSTSAGRTLAISPPTRAYCGANPWSPWWRRTIRSHRRLGPFRSGIWGRIRLYTDRLASWMR